MQPAYKATGLMKLLSVVQIVLALVGIVLLFTTEFATYEVGNPYGYSWGWWYSIWYNENASMWALSAVFLVVLVFIAYSGLMWGWLSSGQTAAKYARLTMRLGFLVIILSILGGIVVYSVALGYGALSFAPGTALYGFLVGGFLFTAIGFIGIRATKPEAPPPPPPRRHSLRICN